jgi:hypothetical protein
VAYLIPSDTGTHAVLGALVLLVLLPFGWPWAVAGCVLAAIGREVYGRIKRARRMNRADWIESALDSSATMAGGAVVLTGAFIGV